MAIQLLLPIAADGVSHALRLSHDFEASNASCKSCSKLNGMEKTSGGTENWRQCLVTDDHVLVAR